jgi:hypothetical protein
VFVDKGKTDEREEERDCVCVCVRETTYKIDIDCRNNLHRKYTLHSVDYLRFEQHNIRVNTFVDTLQQKKKKDYFETNFQTQKQR